MSLLEFHHVYHSSDPRCTWQNYLILDRFRLLISVGIKDFDIGV